MDTTAVTRSSPLLPQAARRATIALTAASLALAGVTALRWVSFGRPILFALVPLAPVGLALTLAALTVVTAARRRFRVAAGVTVAALGVTGWLWPGGIPPRLSCPDGPPPDLTVYSHNIRLGSGDPAATAHQIAALAPDVVLLQEAEVDFVSQVQAALADPYPHSVHTDSGRTRSLATLSRHPITDVVDTSHTTGANPFLVVTTAGIRIANVHFSAPVDHELIEHRANEYRMLAGELPGPPAQLVMGDLNSSSAHRDFQDLLDRGYRDAHHQAGCQLGGTWSPLRRGPGILTLDHALVATAGPGPELQAVSFGFHGYAASDHRGIMVGLTVTPRP